MGHFERGLTLIFFLTAFNVGHFSSFLGKIPLYPIQTLVKLRFFEKKGVYYRSKTVGFWRFWRFSKICMGFKAEKTVFLRKSRFLGEIGSGGNSGVLF